MSFLSNREYDGEIGSLHAVVLAGGFGTRLRSIVAGTPKPLALVAGRPFLNYQLGCLSYQGVKRCVLCVGYRAEVIMDHVGDGSRWGLQVTYSYEHEPMGTGGALALAMPLLKSDPCLVLNGDSLFDCPLGRLLDFHTALGAQASLLLTTLQDCGRYGVVELTPDGQVICFREKGHSGRGLINTGVYLISRTLLGEIPSGHRLSLEYDVFPTWIGREFYGLVAEGNFIDIGTPESYALAQTLAQKWQRYVQGDKNDD